MPSRRIDAVAARALVAEARLNEAGTIEASELGKLTEALIGDVATMIEAVAANDARAAKSAEDRLAAARVKLDGQGLSPDDIVALTGVSESEDSLHRLVMDLHRALNRLAAQCTEEVISGAHAYGIAADDRPVISAFMHGLERTRGLKFDHRGLDTMASRAGSRLIIQNDIGTTDAHVLLVTIERSRSPSPTRKFMSRAQSSLSMAAPTRGLVPLWPAPGTYVLQR